MKNVFKEIRVTKVIINYIHVESYKYNDEKLTQLLEIALDKLDNISQQEFCERLYVSDKQYLN